MKFPKLSAALGFDSIESTSEGVTLQEDQVVAIEAIVAERDTHAATIVNLNSSITSKDEEINALKQAALQNDNTIAQLNADLKTANDANAVAATKDADVTRLTNELKAANDKVEALEAKLAGKPTEEKEPGATGNEGGKEKKKYSYTEKKVRGEI